MYIFTLVAYAFPNKTTHWVGMHVGRQPITLMCVSENPRKGLSHPVTLYITAAAPLALS